MTLQEFLKLDIIEQSDAVFELAVNVDERWDGIFKYNLYQLNSFYIEKKYEISSGSMIGLSAFESSSSILDLYTNHISLKTLFDE